VKDQSTAAPFMAKLRSSIKEARLLPRTLRMVWTASKVWTIAWAIVLFVQGLLPVAVVYLVRAVVNALVAASAAGGDWPHIRAVLFLAAPLGVIMLLAEVLRSLVGWIRTIQAELVSIHIAGLIHEKCATADLAFYETTAFYDLMHQARHDAAPRPLALLENMGGMLQSGVTLVGMAAVLIPLGLWLPLVLLVRTLPAFFTLIHFARLQYAWRTKATPDDRRAQYYDSLLTSAEPAAELRMLGTAGRFRQAFGKLRHKLHLGSLNLKRREILAELCANSLAFVITAVTLAWVVWKTLQGSLVLGDLVLFYQAFNQGQLMLRSLLGNTEQIFSNLLFLGKLYEFLALEPKVVTPAQPVPVPPLQQGIRFEQVNFRYPGSDRLALKDFSLAVPAGQTAAILGPNGSGKSTVIKLLCRLYDPDAGSITLDGTDLRAVNLDELRRAISSLFQMPVRYSATAGENIALGDLPGEPTRDQIESAAREAGVHEIISRLPSGYDCLLGKEFERGTELSGGEWQRIALARAFLRPSPVLLLDEPTSAMDSWAEADWLDRFRQLAQDRTAIIVTHRLSTAMRADIIFVMQRGRVVESGSHRELLAKGGLYATSWAAQTKGAADA
jgi:ATP-binding cassette subfamily B protein